MISVLKFVGHSPLFLQAGKLLLFSVVAGYVSANVRRLTAKYGWDVHFLSLWELCDMLLRGRSPDRWLLWLSAGSGGGFVVAGSVLASQWGL